MNNRIPAKTESARPPIVTIMGHVDHGKTSILDYIRHTNLAAKEYGGITQHIGAYQIAYNAHPITFIDTPGHKAFAQMRARGGKSADIVVLVVAADDGVMPQTKEAMAHAKAAAVPIIVAINKVDLPQADATKAKQQLAQEGIAVEGWGGDVVCVEVSAKTGQGIPNLLDAILAVAEITKLTANPAGELEAIVVEARLDMKRGVVVSAIVRNGTMRVGGSVNASGQTAKIKSLMDDRGNLITTAGPSTPVELLGFKTVVQVGDLIVDAGSELAQLAINRDTVEIIGQDTKRTVNVIIKSDTQGTLEAVKVSLASLVTADATSSYSIKFLLTSTGDVTESDVLLAANTGGIIVGFGVKIPTAAEELAYAKKVVIKTYKTIYELTDEVEDMLKGVAFSQEQKIKGRAQVLKVFELPSGDKIAGCKILAGALKEGGRVAIYDKDPDSLAKEDLPLYVGKVKKLKQKKEDVTIVGKDNDCGILLKPNFSGISESMYIEAI
ncbi:MAG: Translation initiation factor IF-2 [candidate division WWE3 bacterium GW2011_GWA1_46_21]|uniref:Translation initiation factor IF-2 n=3 Tax=Katanobacteria TaxID=422282 RepID=A0A0G1PCA5_UNCKA|nr:MAG: Translation initiation factor IF-2 [candidate division WWE3 bacterium GW2011_GWA1_46_21]KKU48606.1 MAG: Translation initiation factor IF-2 [candidate division WWE3 bacterium GW2011_GWA2_46_9]KKU49950.1 MAG: translation initiation factor IF-2, translation initiation factor IF-2 [candidate division WWE3 bacterium GW2011_GWC1_47_10]